MSDVYIFSTLSNDQIYCQYAPPTGNKSNLSPPIEHAIHIAGKANITDKRLFTPAGVVTTVTAEELQILRNNEVFQIHEKNGYIQVSTSKGDPEKVAASMTGRDESAPLVEEDVDEIKSGKVKVAKK